MREPIARAIPAMTGLFDLPTTERLSLRRLTMDDLEMQCELSGDPEVTRYVGGVKTREETEDMLKTRILPYYQQHPGLGAWATLERATGECIGVHLLNHIQGESLIQVGYILFKKHWGKGYATEMSIALLRYGFSQLQLPQINAITDFPNHVSQRVLLKAGLHRNGERAFSHPRYADGPYAWFERDAAGWLADDRARNIGDPDPSQCSAQVIA
jgi:ribosomal-protein-alanine N-acetyltransferase